MKMVRIPKTIKLGPHTYKIWRSSSMRADDELLGKAHYKRQTIDIDGTMPESELMVIFLHELIHVIARVYHAGDQYSEDTIDSMANGFATFLKDNLDITFDFRDIPNGD